MRNAKYRLIGRILVEKKHYKLVRNNLVLRAKNYRHLDEEGRMIEDSAAYEFIHTVDGNNNALVERHCKFYDRYKKRLIR
jgi:hypothetical protein